MGQAAIFEDLAGAREPWESMYATRWPFGLCSRRQPINKLK